MRLPPSATGSRMVSQGNTNRDTRGMSHPPVSDLDMMRGCYTNSRMVSCIGSLIGSNVEVIMLDGERYSGIFTSYSPDLEVVIEQAHRVQPDLPNLIPSKEKVLDKLIFEFKEIVTVNAVDADTKQVQCSTDSFTDAGVSKAPLNGSVPDNFGLIEWDGGDALETNTDLESGGAGWDAEDMFRQHEKKFGVKSTYNSDLDEYTTKLSSSDSPEHQRKLAEATQLAAQIEGSAMSRANLALENGDQTEEEKFSAVIRPAPQHKSPVKRENLEQRSNKNLPSTHSHTGKSPSVNFSQSARFSKENAAPRFTKAPPPSRPTMDKLRHFKENFKISQVDPSAGSRTSTAPKVDKRPFRHTDSAPISSDAGRSHIPASKDSKFTTPASEIPVSKVTATTTSIPPKVTASQAKLTNTAASPVSTSAAAVTPSSSTSTSSAVTAAAAAPSAIPASSSSTSSQSESETSASKTDAKPTTAISQVKTATESTLNPEAKEFVFTPRQQPVAVPPQPAQPTAQQQQPVTHHSSHHKSKTATVSVEAARAPARTAEMPSAAHAMGAPITINQQPPFIMVPQPTRLQRVPSYPGSDVPPPGHPPYIQAQPMIPGQFPLVAGGPHVIPIPGPGNLAVAAPHNAPMHHQPPPPHQQAAVLANSHHPGAMPPAHHMPHANPAYNNQGAGINYMYAMPPPHAGQPNPPAQLPHSSPHPSPSPSNVAVSSYGGYVPPPQSQQFYHAAPPSHPNHPPPYPPNQVLYIKEVLRKCTVLYQGVNLLDNFPQLVNINHTLVIQCHPRLNRLLRITLGIPLTNSNKMRIVSKSLNNRKLKEVAVPKTRC
ncbi:ATXN2 [Bugula neritina]|uniref:ATXN2 n=1 Tax=Bugula neritina TaxID=10212 RepID=A0A7J7JB89_BUGNE|nr:ATXN2 [Bugula neritina]